MRKRLQSFRHAFRGLWFALREEENFFIEAVIAVIVLIAMFTFPISVTERGLLVLVILLILILELVNTAVEKTMDILKPREHPYVKVVKDVMAAAVLVGSAGAVLIGGIIFYPHIQVVLEQLF